MATQQELADLLGTQAEHIYALRTRYAKRQEKAATEAFQKPQASQVAIEGWRLSASASSSPTLRPAARRARSERWTGLGILAIAAFTALACLQVWPKS